MTVTGAPLVEQFHPDRLEPAADNLRSEMGDIEGLAASIKAGGGVLQSPILATTQADSDKLLIVAGHRRHAAVKLLGLELVDVIVFEELDESARAEMMLVENLQREDFTALDKARGFKRLADAGLTQRQIAEKVGVSQAAVSKHLALLKLPEEALEQVTSGELSQESAVTLAGLPKDLQEQALRNGQIAWAKRRADDRKRYAEEVKALEKAGVRKVDLDEVADSDSLERVSWMHWVKKHYDEPCRAYAVNADGAPIEICTEPSRHPGPKPQATSAAPSKVESAAAKADREEAERLWGEWVEVSKRRRKWLVDVPANAELDAVTIRLFLKTEAVDMPTPDLLELLGSEVDDVMVDDRKDWNATREAQQAALLAMTKTPQGARQILFLTLALDFEMQLDGVPPSRTSQFRRAEWHDRQSQAYFGVLADLGYEISTIEKRYIGLPWEEAEEAAEPSPVEDATEPTDEAPDAGPVVTVTERRGKFHIACSEHGEIGFNTNRPDADQRGQEHLRDEHGIEVAA